MAGRTIAQYKGNKTKKQLQEDFLRAFEACASVSEACRKSKLPRRTVYDWFKSNKAFKKRYDEAAILALGVLEDEATRRAVNGLEKPVFQGGKLVGRVREYSDTLLIVLLKARAPLKYRENFKATLSNPDGTPLLTEIKVNVIHSGAPISEKEEDVI